MKTRTSVKNIMFQIYIMILTFVLVLFIDFYMFKHYLIHIMLVKELHASKENGVYLFLWITG